MSDIWYLENIDLYNILCPSKLKGYSQKHFKKFKKGEYIYSERDTAKNIYLISKGKVKIVHYTSKGDELVLAILKKGELFGEKALLGEQNRDEFAISLDEETLLCPLDIETMHNLMREDKRFSLAIYKIIGFRIKKLEQRLENLFFKDVRTRLIDFIKELTVNIGYSEDQTITINHYYTQKDIANLIGTSRETVTKLFNELKNEGVLRYKRKQIILYKSHLFRERNLADI